MSPDVALSVMSCFSIVSGDGDERLLRRPRRIFALIVAISANYDWSTAMPFDDCRNTPMMPNKRE